MARVLQDQWDNGLTVLIEPLARPAAALQILLPTGGAGDPAGGEGTAAVLHHFAQRGAGERDTRALSEAIDGLGARRGGGAGRDATTWSLTCLADDWSAAAGLIADSVRAPRLPDDAFEPCRALVAQELAGLDDDPGQKLMVALTGRYFPGAFGRCLLGSGESLAALSAQTVRDAWRASWRPQGAVVAVAGGVEPQAALDRLRELFGDWDGAAPALPPVEPRASFDYGHVAAETQQVHLGLAYADVPPDHPQRYEAQMAVQVLSGGMGARLCTEVREKRGLCYAVGAYNQVVKGHGYVIARAGTTTERSSETLAVLADELTALPGTVTDAEVERGRVRLLSNLVMNDESTLARAARLANDHYLLGRVRSV